VSEWTTVIVSRDPTTNPARRALEDDIAAGAHRAGLDVLVVGPLYDLKPDGPGWEALRPLTGDLIVWAWLYPRSTYWILDRRAIRGRLGRIPDSAAGAPLAATEHAGSDRGIAPRPVPARMIHCLDLRAWASAGACLDEIARLVSGRPGRFVGEDAEGHARPAPAAGDGRRPDRGLREIDEVASRRWYPVIDYSRCTNCMECIDFCLFGVYGLDRRDALVVEQPDSCRKGCPACSRVCPENAILFPRHKAPGIAGGPPDDAGRKLDLSHLLGAPDNAAAAIGLAARERDEHLLAAGRAAMGLSTGTASPGDAPPSTASSGTPATDKLDQLLDQLDKLDL
jgi:NAD-dependent dihydropyrimidine dehydrogenase PreA subunit